MCIRDSDKARRVLRLPAANEFVGKSIQNLGPSLG